MSPKRVRTSRHNKTVMIYNSGKKGKKASINNYEQSRNSLENWEFYFKSNELDEIKLIIKSTDLNDVPLLIGAVVLDNKEVLNSLLIHGYNLNEPDKNNLTPLYWAVKLKLLDIIQLLLENHADASIKPPNEDNVIFYSIASSFWDEESFMVFFNHLKKSDNLHVSNVNINGYTLLHLAVQKEWILLTDVLIMNEANVNAITPSGVTSLMFASYLNNYYTVCKLLNCGASVKKRNADGFTALCYAFSSAVAKNLEPPFLIVEKLQIEMNKNEIDLKTYLKARMKILNIRMKRTHQDLPNPEVMIQNIVNFVMRHVNGAFLLFCTELEVGQLLKEALERFLDDKECLKLSLIVLNSIFKNIDFTMEANNLILQGFINSGCFDNCLSVLRKYNDDEIFYMALTSIILCSPFYNFAQEWFELNKDELIIYLSKCQHAEFMKIKTSEVRMIQERLEVLKINLLNYIPAEDALDLNSPLHDKLESKISYSKKNKRRTKAMKAKMARMKTAELTERFNLCKIKDQQFFDDPEIAKYVNFCPPEEENVCVNAVKMAIGILDDDNESVESNSNKLSDSKNQQEDWKSTIKKLPFENSSSKLYKTLNSDDKPRYVDVDLTVKYLESLLGMIVSRYKDIWQMDKPQESDTDSCEFDCIIPPLEIDFERLQNQEKDQLRLVYREFYNVTRNIKQSFDIDPERCQQLLKELEKLLLSHSIRGQSIVSSATVVEVVKLKVSMPEESEHKLASYVEGVIAGDFEESPDVKISVQEHLTAHKHLDHKSMGDYIYLNEIAGLLNKRSQCVSHHPLTPPSSSILNIWEEMEKRSEQMCCFKECAIVNKIPQPERDDSKWCSLIRSLAMMEDCQMFFNGSIRISNIEKRKSHVLSPNGNFAVLEMGLDRDNNPLAVKIMAKNDPFASTLKSQIDPLLNLEHKNILQYHTCAYHGNVLIIVTPLCEYNLGQYVLKMRYSTTQICKVNVIKQLLTGLMYLHDHDEPIVHGNLKPSNILIDINGTVKVAEFGIQKALMKNKNLPESSIIWFATELYQLYKQDLVPECTCASDIQVAGMLVHFAINCGSHPFGKDVPDILKNLEKACADFSVSDMELYDLLTWMLLGEPSQRPSMHQVLSHIFFWSKQKKWTYILLCAGLGIMSTIPMDIEKLHSSLDKIALKENINGNCWVLTARKQYPEIALGNVSDTPSGLLKFIKDVVENNVHVGDDVEKNFNSFIMNSFPHFALSLYRMIENTEWSDHRVFMPFHNVVDY